jgi:prevent-host-death family protein
VRTVGALEGKRHFSHLLADVEAGETIVITRNGRAVARLEPIPPDTPGLTPDDAFAALLSMDKPLGASLQTLIDEGRQG